MDFPSNGIEQVGIAQSATQDAGGDNATNFDRIYDRYAAFVYNTCLAMLGHPDNARDAMQETFIQIYRSLESFRGESALSTWIHRIATRKCLDLARKNKRCEPVDPAELPAAPDAPAPDRELEHRVRATLLQLKPEYRLVLILYHYQNLSYQEIADALHCSADQVRVRLHRARHAFRARYGGSDEL